MDGSPKNHMVAIVPTITDDNVTLPRTCHSGVDLHSVDLSMDRDGRASETRSLFRVATVLPCAKSHDWCEGDPLMQTLHL